MRKIGIDISHWQGSFENKGNIDFVIQKVSGGLYKDSLYDELLPSVRTVEHRGGYHYFTTNDDPAAQAELFYNAQAGQGFKFLCMDYERHGNALNGRGEENLWTFYQKLLELTSKPIYLYATEYVLRDNLLVYNDRWLDIPFWTARWNKELDEQTDEPLFLDLGNEWVIWQYSADGNGKGAEYGVDSVDVDLNVWNDQIEKECPEMKKWYASRTLWFSILFAIVNLAGAFGFAEFVPGDAVSQYVSVAMSIIMAVLRLKTDKGVEI